MIRCCLGKGNAQFTLDLFIECHEFKLKKCRTQVELALTNRNGRRIFQFHSVPVGTSFKYFLVLSTYVQRKLALASDLGHRLTLAVIIGQCCSIRTSKSRVEDDSSLFLHLDFRKGIFKIGCSVPRKLPNYLIWPGTFASRILDPAKLTVTATPYSSIGL